METEGRGRFLIGETEASAAAGIRAVLTEAGHEVRVAESAPELFELAAGEDVPDMALVDLGLPPAGGIDALERLKAARPTLLVVMTGGEPSLADVLDAFRKNAFDFLVKPVEAERTVALAQRAVEIRELGQRRRRMAEDLETERRRAAELARKLGDRDPFVRLVGGSPAVARLVETIREVARTDSTVLLTGESGTGKGLVARTIHDASERAHGPFVEANCVVYSEGVLHSELFGHERGAFTGAARTKRGRFELAAGGTLFLDEIGEISTATQLLLLRVLQDRTFERVGGEQTLEADVRLVAATNRDLQRALEEGTFRSDLFYRLNVIPLQLPALREHPDDIPQLAQHFLDRAAERLGRQVEGFSPAAMEALVRHRWPGNIRELENTIERMLVLNRTGLVDVVDLPPALREGAAAASATPARGTLQSLERDRIVEGLREAGGNKKLAARKLGIHRSTLYAKLRRYGLLEAQPAGRESRQDGEDVPTPALTS